MKNEIINKTRETMAETTSSTWTKLLEIPFAGETYQDAKEAINKFTDAFIDYDDEDWDRLFNSSFIEFCADGIIIWEA